MLKNKIKIDDGKDDEADNDETATTEKDDSPESNQKDDSGTLAATNPEKQVEDPAVDDEQKKVDDAKSKKDAEQLEKEQEKLKNFMDRVITMAGQIDTLNLNPKAIEQVPKFSRFHKQEKNGGMSKNPRFNTGYFGEPWRFCVFPYHSVNYLEFCRHSQDKYGPRQVATCQLSNCRSCCLFQKLAITKCTQAPQSKNVLNISDDQLSLQFTNDSVNECKLACANEYVPSNYDEAVPKPKPQQKDRVTKTVMITQDKKGKAETPEQFNALFKDQKTPFYIEFNGGKDCNPQYKTIIYKRKTPIDNTNMYDLFLINWFDKNKGIKNTFHEDFDLFSSLQEAQNDKEPWQFCNFNDAGVGFPRDCGKNGNVGGNWIARSPRFPNRLNGWKLSLIEFSKVGPGEDQILPYTLGDNKMFGFGSTEVFNDKKMNEANKLAGEALEGEKAGLSGLEGGANAQESKCETAIENQKVNLNCPGKIGKIEMAQYGVVISGCEMNLGAQLQKDVKDKVSHCIGQKACQVKASNALKGDPAPFIKKSLKIKYTCE